MHLFFLDVKAVRIQKYFKEYTITHYSIYRVYCKFSVLQSYSCFIVQNTATQNHHMAYTEPAD